MKTIRQAVEHLEKRLAFHQSFTDFSKPRTLEEQRKKIAEELPFLAKRLESDLSEIPRGSDEFARVLAAEEFEKTLSGLLFNTQAAGQKESHLLVPGNGKKTPFIVSELTLEHPLVESVAIIHGNALPFQVRLKLRKGVKIKDEKGLAESLNSKGFNFQWFGSYENFAQVRSKEVSWQKVALGVAARLRHATPSGKPGSTDLMHLQPIRKDRELAEITFTGKEHLERLGKVFLDCLKAPAKLKSKPG